MNSNTIDIIIPPESLHIDFWIPPQRDIDEGENPSIGVFIDGLFAESFDFKTLLLEHSENTDYDRETLAQWFDYWAEELRAKNENG